MLVIIERSWHIICSSKIYIYCQLRRQCNCYIIRVGYLLGKAILLFVHCSSNFLFFLLLYFISIFLEFKYVPAYIVVMVGVLWYFMVVIINLVCVSECMFVWCSSLYVTSLYSLLGKIKLIEVFRYDHPCLCVESALISLLSPP